jgi:hypothetical protein
VNSDFVKPIAQLLDLALRIPTLEDMCGPFFLILFFTYSTKLPVRIVACLAKIMKIQKKVNPIIAT